MGRYKIAVRDLDSISRLRTALKQHQATENDLKRWLTLVLHEMKNRTKDYEKHWYDFILEWLGRKIFTMKNIVNVMSKFDKVKDKMPTPFLKILAELIDKAGDELKKHYKEK